MPYAQDRIIHDADSHLMEPPDCLDAYFEARLLARFRDLAAFRTKFAKSELIDRARAEQADPAFRAGAEENLLLRKNYQALGAFLREDRVRAIDFLGFASQLVFTTFCL